MRRLQLILNILTSLSTAICQEVATNTASMMASQLENTLSSSTIKIKENYQATESLNDEPKPTASPTALTNSKSISTKSAVISPTNALAKLASATRKTTTTLASIPEVTNGFDKIICINNFGRCLNHERISECPSKSAAVKGICGNVQMLCCIDSQIEQNLWSLNDSGCEHIFGTCRLDTEQCSGVSDSASCGGPIQRKCCSPSKDQVASWIAKDTPCIQQLGICQITTSECAGNFQKDQFCGGPSNRQCCVPSMDTQKEWTNHDGLCNKDWGTCQPKPLGCAGGSFQTGLCGGPEARECCVPSSETIATWATKEIACTVEFGKCQHASEFCNGTKQENTDMCQGPPHRICCTPSYAAIQSWSNHDAGCLNKNGKCQHISTQCHGAYDRSSTCGGPIGRQCCVPAKKTNRKNGDGLPSSIPSARAALLVVASLLVIIVTIGIIFAAVKKWNVSSYKRVRGGSWYERNGTEETLNLTSGEEEKPNYA